MFYPAIAGLINTMGYEFIPETHDTQQLNSLAESESDVDVTAISLHAYPYLADKYYILPHGGSIGRGYGPVIVAKQPMNLSELKNQPVAIPGLRTTAYLVLKLMIPDIKAIVVPIEPFYKIFDCITSGEVKAGVIIHEGRLMVEDRKLVTIVDQGVWWQENYGLPLPLGINVIRKDLGDRHIPKISRVLQASIRYSLQHKDEIISLWQKKDPRGIKELNDQKKIENYLNLYANQDTLEFQKDAMTAASLLLELGYESGIIPTKPRLLWVES